MCDDSSDMIMIRMCDENLMDRLKDKPVGWVLGKIGTSFILQENMILRKIRFFGHIIKKEGITIAVCEKWKGALSRKTLREREEEEDH